VLGLSASKESCAANRGEVAPHAVADAVDRDAWPSHLSSNPPQTLRGLGLSASQEYCGEHRGEVAAHAVCDAGRDAVDRGAWPSHLSSNPPSSLRGHEA